MTSFLNGVFKDVFAYGFELDDYFEAEFNAGIQEVITQYVHIYPKIYSTFIDNGFRINDIYHDDAIHYHINIRIEYPAYSSPTHNTAETHMVIYEHSDYLDIHIMSKCEGRTFHKVEHIKGIPYDEYLRLKLQYA